MTAAPVDVRMSQPQVGAGMARSVVVGRHFTHFPTGLLSVEGSGSVLTSSPPVEAGTALRGE